MIRLLVVLICLGSVARAERAGDFSYYVMALSWSPTWCALEGDARGADQCDARHDYGFILHGLWPQYARGWPEFCQTSQRPPTRRMTGEMIDIMGSSGLAWYQWRKHGTCTGLSAANYYRLSRLAYGKIARPEILRRIPRELAVPARVVEDAFLEANPGMTRDQITVTCRSRRIAEVRVCLTRDLELRQCGADVIRDCGLEDALIAPIR